LGIKISHDFSNQDASPQRHAQVVHGLCSQSSAKFRVFLEDLFHPVREILFLGIKGS
jgi:hypothetical protein